MSWGNFDEEIAKLYQQRKQHIVAPTIKLTQESYTKKNSFIKICSLLLTAGMASFGIMAIISHFSTLPNNITPDNSVDHSVKLIELAPKLPDEKQVLAAKLLPLKPESTSPVTQQTLSPKKQSSNEPIMPDVSNAIVASVISLPSLFKPTIVIEPTYKVLPKCSSHAKKSYKEGEIKLSYQIDAAGKTNNISIISSSVDRSLQRAAKKALSQWQYKPNKLTKDSYHQVIFKFTKPEG